MAGNASETDGKRRGVRAVKLSLNQERQEESSTPHKRGKGSG